MSSAQDRDESAGKSRQEHWNIGALLSKSWDGSILAQSSQERLFDSFLVRNPIAPTLILCSIYGSVRKSCLFLIKKPKPIRQKEKPARRGDVSHYGTFSSLLWAFRYLIRYHRGWVDKRLLRNQTPTCQEDCHSKHFTYKFLVTSFAPYVGKLRATSEFHPWHLYLMYKPDLASATSQKRLDCGRSGFLKLCCILGSPGEL